MIASTSPFRSLGTMKLSWTGIAGIAASRHPFRTCMHMRPSMPMRWMPASDARYRAMGALRLATSS